MTSIVKKQQDQIHQLFYIEDSEKLSKKDKIEYLSEVLEEVETLENSLRRESDFISWTGMGQVLSTSFIVIASGTINPLLALTTVCLSIASTGAGLTATVKNSSGQKYKTDRAVRYRLCLQSRPLSDWAALWHTVGTDLFARSLDQGATGEIVVLGDDYKLVKRSRRGCFDTALAFCADCHSITPSALGAEIERVKTGAKSIIPKWSATPVDETDAKDSHIASSANTFIQPAPTDFEELRNNALAIRNALVEQAAAQSLGGCIILSAPGAGKTTFLGSAWLKLKQQHGSNFKSLALVMKKKDVKPFESVADKVIWVKNHPKYAAVEAIKFIDSTMEDEATINRLFIDDYLAAQELFDSSIGGTYIDLDTYATFSSQKEANDLGSYEAIPLKAALNARLKEYWTVGREFNSCLWVSSHSPNVEDLPFCGSASARSIGNFIILAKDDNREFIELALANAKLISDGGKRKEIKAKLDSLKVTSGEPLTLANTNNWVLGIVPQSIRSEYEGLVNSTQTTRIQKPVQETVIQSSQDTVLQEIDSIASPDSDELNKELKAASLGITKEALAVYEKLKTFEYGAKVRDIVQSKPFGKVKTPTSKVKYYLDELVIAELVIKTQDGNTELFSCVEL